MSSLILLIAASDISLEVLSAAKTCTSSAEHSCNSSISDHKEQQSPISLSLASAQSARTSDIWWQNTPISINHYTYYKCNTQCNINEWITIMYLYISKDLVLGKLIRLLLYQFGDIYIFMLKSFQISLFFCIHKYKQTLAQQ